MQKYFSVIEDPRHQSYIKHNLCDVLTIVMCAVLCGMDELNDVVAYAQNKNDFLKSTFGIQNIPSKPTLSRILGMVDGEKVASVIVELLKEKIGTNGGVIAVDGKAIRSTSKAERPHSTLQIITAYLTENGVILGQEKIYEKTNEIPVFQEMLEYLDVRGKTVTADAMHCQRATSAIVKEKGGEYVFGLKGNQKSLHDDVALYFDEPSHQAGVEEFTTFEKNGGRGEKRICRKMIDARWLIERHNWPGLRTAFSVERITCTSRGDTRETSYYITSLDASAEELLRTVREHWKIESMHWMLDVVFSEDESRFLSEKAHMTMNSFRKCSLALHKKYLAGRPRKTSIRRNLFNCLLNDSILMDVFSAL